jgi:hypothetical protein
MNLTPRLRRWSHSAAATAAVISAVLVGLVSGVVGLGILAVHLLGTPGVGVSLLIAAVVLGPGMMYIDKKLTP